MTTSDDMVLWWCDVQGRVLRDLDPIAVDTLWRLRGVAGIDTLVDEAISSLLAERA